MAEEKRSVRGGFAITALCLALAGCLAAGCAAVTVVPGPGRPLPGAVVFDSALLPEEDEPLAAVTRMAFDPAAQKVVPADESGRHLPRLDGAADHFFFEAEEMIATATYVNIEWVSLRTGYPELFPAGLPTEVPRPLATSAPFLSGTGVAAILPGERTSTLSQRLEIENGGSYRPWVRYQSIQQLPAPFEVVVEQGGEELLRQRFNEESTALCRLAARLLWEAAEPVTLAPGEAFVRLVKTADEDPGPLRGPRYVDCFLLTSDLDYIPGGGELLPGPAQLRRRAAAYDRDGARVVQPWHRGRYEGFFRTSWPDGEAALDPSFSLDLAGNAHGNEQLLVTSLVGEPLEFTARVTLADGRGRPFPGEVEVLQVGHMVSRFFDTVPHVLFRRRRVALAPYHTAGLWLRVFSGSAPAGGYRGALELLSGDRVISRTPLEVRVRARAIPEDPDLHVLIWGRHLPPAAFYDEAEMPAMREKYWANALAHGWNVFWYDTPWPAAEARRRGVRALIATGMPHPRHHFGRREIALGGEEFNRQIRERLEERVDPLLEKGWTEDELWIQAYDEPSGAPETWLAYARAVKAARPEARMWINPGWHRGQREASFRAWAPYVDIWWPFASNLSQPDLLAAMEETGRPIGFYIERGWSGFNPGAAWAYFRRMPMLAAKYELQGAGFWSATSWYRDPWDDLNTRTNYGKAAVFYPGTRGPVNAVNFAAWREGLDELLMLRSLAAAGRIDPVAWGQKFLDADSLAAQDRLRRELLDLFAPR